MEPVLSSLLTVTLFGRFILCFFFTHRSVCIFKPSFGRFFKVVDINCVVWACYFVIMEHTSKSDSCDGDVEDISVD
jgi:hypothetical protein